MTKSTLKRQAIFEKLRGFSEQELVAIVEFMEFMKFKKGQPAKQQLLKLEGMLKGCDIEMSDLKKFRKQTWKHVDKKAG